MTDQNTKPSHTKDFSPIKLGVLAIIAYLALSLLVFIYNGYKGGDRVDNYWLLGASILYVFVIFNCLFYFSANNNVQYWKQSLFSFSGLFISIIVASMIFSGKTIDEAATFRWIFLVIIVCYFVFFGISSFIKFFVKISEEEDWKGPKGMNNTKK